MILREFESVYCGKCNWKASFEVPQKQSELQELVDKLRECPECFSKMILRT